MEINPELTHRAYLSHLFLQSTSQISLDKTILQEIENFKSRVHIILQIGGGFGDLALLLYRRAGFSGKIIILDISVMVGGFNLKLHSQ